MHTQKKTFFLIFSIFIISLLAACGASVDDPETHDEDSHESSSEHDGESDHDDDTNMEDESTHEHEEGGTERVMNDGAVISISSPSDNSSFAFGESIVIEVEVENFTLDEDGSHWHVYVDDVSYGMVLGNNHDEVLRNLEPGEHVVSVYLAHGTHEELMEGDSITITVSE